MIRSSAISGIGSSGRIGPLPAALALALCANVTAAAQVPEMAEILRRSGEQAEVFWKDISSVTYRESVRQAKLNQKLRRIFEEDAEYDSLVTLETAGGDIRVSESRQRRQGGRPAGKPAALLLTNGFSLLTLIFHPLYQSTFEFSFRGEEMMGGRRAFAVAFRHFRGERSPSALLLSGKAFPLNWDGTAWLDAGTCATLRIDAVAGPAAGTDAALRLTASVEYAPVQFGGGRAAIWLPARAVIDAETAHQHWRNVHSLSGYRIFDVNTTVRTGSPQ